MPAATPNALQASVIRMLMLGVDRDFISAVTDLSERTIWSIEQNWKQTSSFHAPERHGVKGRPRLLELGDIWYICDRITQQPDIFLDELQKELDEIAGIEVDISTVWRALRRLGITRKVLDKRAIERCEEERTEFRRLMKAFRPDQLVFVDESLFNRKATYRNRGYTLSGERAVTKTFTARGKRYSVLPAMSLSGILTALIVQGSYNKPLFVEFMELCLAVMNPFPQENSVLVLDNCSIHNSPQAKAMATACGVLIIFLPPYSPDFNPIELAFSQMKASYRRDGQAAAAVLNQDNDSAEADAQAMLFRHIYTVQPKDAESYFRHCGYLTE